MKEEKSGTGQNIISLPQGGGAISGMGESFSPNLFTGTGNFSVPIALPPGRNGLQPSLSLGYSTGNGNSCFGIGWDLALPQISRKTNLGIPIYDDNKDVFVLSGAEDLIPVDRQQVFDEVTEITTTTMTYKPRTEGLFARIQHIKSSDGKNFWRVKTKDGMTTYYGLSYGENPRKSVLTDPENEDHIACWKIASTVDPFGNSIEYEYIEDKQSLSFTSNQLYLSKIYYNYYLHEAVKKNLHTVVFEYEDREDSFSSFRFGFDNRTRKRCARIDTFSHPLDDDMPEGYVLNNNDNSIAIRSYIMNYMDELGIESTNKASILKSVTTEGYHLDETESLPPVEFTYSDFDISRKDIRPIAGEHLPNLTLNDPELDLIDLDGNGLPDFVQMSANQAPRVWKNKGNGNFSRAQNMKTSPLGLSLADPGVQLMDADGDGRIDLVINRDNFAGYYSLNHDGEWDKNSFRKYKTRPPLNLQSAQVQFMDLTGDGRTDLMVNGNKLECYFQNSALVKNNGEENGLQESNTALGWSDVRFVNKRGLDDFPNVNFSDPRIRTGNFNGDGLQDVVQIQNGSVTYWPNKGYGNFGRKRTMRNSPKFGFNYNPAQLLLADVDGDGLTDLIYVENNKITIWINQSGNAWSEPIEILGTPRFTNRDSVRVVDIMGTGTAGILWSSYSDSASVNRHEKFYYLDINGGMKPYIMTEMKNNLGATTKVEYKSSVYYYLLDRYGEKDGLDTASEFTGTTGNWKTKLPFPVQVVSQVEVIDDLSKGKLTTRYFYHHGYWDGAEREYRGFGRVDQFDTETFDRYNVRFDSAQHDINADDFAGVSETNYIPPVLVKNWFHLGPVGAEFGDWKELDFAEEFWDGDQNMLQRPAAMRELIGGLPRRAKRDAYRTLRGASLRTELYSMDGTEKQHLPYSVSETQTGLRLEDSPSTNEIIEVMGSERHSNHIFFSYGISSRSTQWERGNEPMTSFSFTENYDNYGQAMKQINIAVPRGKDPLTGDPLPSAGVFYDPIQGYHATVNESTYIYVNEDEQYMVNRVCKSQSREAVNVGTQSVFELKSFLLEEDSANLNLLGLSYTYYDGSAYSHLDYENIGSFGVPTRSISLAMTPMELNDIYAGEAPPFYSEMADPVWSGFPSDFVTSLQEDRAGYKYQMGGGPENFEQGWYIEGPRTKFDFQEEPIGSVGLPLAVRDIFDYESTITYDTYKLMPVASIDPVGMTSSAEYDYRLMQVTKFTDPNNNKTAFGFSPLGLMTKTALLGKDNGEEGDTLSDPGVVLEYDLFSYANEGKPAWVKTIQREHHVNDSYTSDLTLEEKNRTITAIEFSDGFGRQLQTRSQAEDVIYGNQLLGDSGLDEDNANSPAVGIERAPEDPFNVVVSGCKIYNNKGLVVEQWEPFYDQGFDYVPCVVQEIEDEDDGFITAINFETNKNGIFETSVTYDLTTDENDPNVKWEINGETANFGSVINRNFLNDDVKSISLKVKNPDLLTRIDSCDDLGITSIEFLATNLRGNLYFDDNDIDVIDVSSIKTIGHFFIRNNPNLSSIIFGVDNFSASGTSLRITGSPMMTSLDTRLIQHGDTILADMPNLTTFLFKESEFEITQNHQLGFINTGMTALDFSNGLPTRVHRYHNNEFLTSLILHPNEPVGINSSGICNLSNNALTHFSGATAIAQNAQVGETISLNNNNFSASAINQMLAEFDNALTEAPVHPNMNHIRLDGTGNAAPDETSGGVDGCAALRSLINKGYNVITNGTTCTDTPVQLATLTTDVQGDFKAEVAPANLPHIFSWEIVPGIFRYGTALDYNFDYPGDKVVQLSSTAGDKFTLSIQNPGSQLKSISFYEGTLIQNIFIDYQKISTLSLEHVSPIQNFSVIDSNQVGNATIDYNRLSNIEFFPENYNENSFIEINGSVLTTLDLSLIHFRSLTLLNNSELESIKFHSMSMDASKPLNDIIINNNPNLLSFENLEIFKRYPEKNKNIDLSNNALNVATVSQLLVTVNNHLNATNLQPAFSPEINLSGGSNAAPNAAGLVAKAELINRGVVVTTN